MSGISVNVQIVSKYGVQGFVSVKYLEGLHKQYFVLCRITSLEFGIFGLHCKLFKYQIYKHWCSDI